jgi:DNA polymerase-3 subunit gamma/tau
VPETVADDLPEREVLLSLAQKISPETLQLYYQIALLGRRDIGLAPDEYAGFTMSLLRMLAFTPNEINTTASANKPAQTAPAAQRTVPVSPPVSKPTAVTPITEPAEKPATPVETFNQQRPVDVQVQAEAAAPSEFSNDQNGSNFNGNWRGLVDELKLGLARELAKHCELVTYDENSISLSVPEAQKHLVSPNYQEKLGTAITQYFGKKIKLQFSIGGTGNTPAKQISQEKALAQANAESAIEEDGFVQALINDFGATIIPNSIKPV